MFTGALSIVEVAISCVTKTSGPVVREGAISVASATRIGSNAAGVAEIKIGGTGEDVGAAPGNAVGVAYCPHNDALLTHEAVAKVTPIKRAKTRFTIRPFRELYLLFVPSAECGGK